MKILGVSSCFMYPDKDRLVFGPKTLCYLEKDMARFLARPDVMPVLVPDIQDDALEGFVDKCDGFVFQGGTDIAPQTYHAKPILENRWPGDPVRDAYELKLMEMAIQKGKPVFGICRGFQLMNVYFGGSLYQDIKTEKENSLIHRDADLYDQLAHEVSFTSGGLFDRIHGGRTGKVNSVHHQGVKTLGADLIVEAVSIEDGIVEAFSWSKAEEGKVMGVQWHPEFFYNYHEGGLVEGNAVYDVFLSGL